MRYVRRQVANYHLQGVTIQDCSVKANEGTNGQDVPVLVFLMFCSEGDNAQDAIGLAQQLNGWMNLISKKLIFSTF
nr:hypothetical protein BaRGS_034089 [Batillaria attramentaria]